MRELFNEEKSYEGLPNTCTCPVVLLCSCRKRSPVAPAGSPLQYLWLHLQHSNHRESGANEPLLVVECYWKVIKNNVSAKDVLINIV